VRAEPGIYKRGDAVSMSDWEDVIPLWRDEVCPEHGTGAKRGACECISRSVAIVLVKEIKMLRGALGELVRLKELRENHGKTHDYRANQSVAWDRAREALGGEP
jgi:hypothetical protein